MRGSTFLLEPSSFDCQKYGKIPIFFLSLSSSLSLSVFPLSPSSFVFFLFPFISSLIPLNSHLFAPLHLISLYFVFHFLFSHFFSLTSLISFIFSFLFPSYPFLFLTQRIILVCFLSPFLFCFPSSMPHVFSTFFLDFLSFSFSLLLHHALHG